MSIHLSWLKSSAARPTGNSGMAAVTRAAEAGNLPSRGFSKIAGAFSEPVMAMSTARSLL